MSETSETSETSLEHSPSAPENLPRATVRKRRRAVTIPRPARPSAIRDVVTAVERAAREADEAEVARHAKARAVAALAAGGSVADARRAAGASYATLREWCRESAFREAIEQQISYAAATARHELSRAAGAAVTAIVAALDDEDPHVRLSAARDVLRVAGVAPRAATQIAIDARQQQLVIEQPPGGAGAGGEANDSILPPGFQF